jgi:hypothetical protein
MWASARRLGKDLGTRFLEGTMLVHGGPSGRGRSTIIDATQNLGGHPVEQLQRGLSGTGVPGTVRGLFDEDMGRTRAEGMAGWLTQQGNAMWSLFDWLHPKKGKTANETFMTNGINWMKNNVGSELNPMTMPFSDATIRFMEASAGRGRTVRDVVRGLQKPELEGTSLADRLGTALTRSIFSVRDVPSDSVVSGDEFTSFEALERSIIGERYGTSAAGDPKEKRTARVARIRSEEQIRMLFRGAYERVHREGWRTGGWDAVVSELIDISDDIEWHVGDGGSGFRLIPGRTKQQLSTLGKFIAAQPEEARAYAIDFTLDGVKRAFDSDAAQALGWMVQRQEVDGAIAERVFDAIMHPRTGVLLRLLDDKSQKRQALPTYYRVWRAVVNETDADSLQPSDRRVYERLARRFTAIDPTQVDMPGVIETLGPIVPDLLPKQFLTNPEAGARR